MTKAEAMASSLQLNNRQETRPPTGLWRDVLYRLRRHRIGMIGVGIVAALILLGVLGPLLAPHDPNVMDFNVRFAPPSLAHPLGADDFGRDILSRIMVGARVSLQVGLIAVGIAGVAGTLLGLAAGYSNRVLDEIIMRSMDVLFAFPAILLAIAILAALGKGIANAMIAIGVVYTPIFARIARGAVLTVRRQEFVEAALAIGAGRLRILFRHIFPNSLAPLIVEASLSLAFAILAEAALSFFGLGTQPPDPSWGRMLSEGRAYFRQSIWMGIFPGLAIMLTVMGFNFLGDGLRDVLDPRMKQ
ncbi:MAG: ABC transporter permease [Caldilineaceae bacterium]